MYLKRKIINILHSKNNGVVGFLSFGIITISSMIIPILIGITLTINQQLILSVTIVLSFIFYADNKRPFYLWEYLLFPFDIINFFFVYCTLYSLKILILINKKVNNLKFIQYLELENKPSNMIKNAYNQKIRFYHFFISFLNFLSLIAIGLIQEDKENLFTFSAFTLGAMSCLYMIATESYNNKKKFKPILMYNYILHFQYKILNSSFNITKKILSPVLKPLNKKIPQKESILLKNISKKEKELNDKSQY